MSSVLECCLKFSMNKLFKKFICCFFILLLFIQQIDFTEFFSNYINWLNVIIMFVSNGPYPTKLEIQKFVS